MPKLAAVGSKRLGRKALAKHIFKMPAGLFDVGNLRLGDGFLKVKNILF